MYLIQTIKVKVEVQLTLVSIVTNKQKVTLGDIYCPPRHNLKKDDYQTILEQPGQRFIIRDDINIDWGSRLTITKGKELRQAE